VPRIVRDAATFRASRAWGAQDIAEVEGASVRLHWTDRPYRWHRNDGVEAFVVLAGEVDMRYRADGSEHRVRLSPADIFVAEEGDEHVAHPVGEARILVVERRGST
jgi:mannose-6-phosphate isomerase-like protein (cupin superfamily)